MPLGEEGGDGGATVGLQAEYGRELAGVVSGEQFEAVVAAVVDDEVGAGKDLQVGESGLALVAVRVEVEIDGQAGVQAVQAAQQTLWQEQEARLRDHPMQLVHPRQLVFVLVGFPADPAVAAAQREGALLEQHRAERSLLAVVQQVAQMGPTGWR